MIVIAYLLILTIIKIQFKVFDHSRVLEEGLFKSKMD